MTKCHVIDTFPDFLRYWTEYGEEPMAVQIDAWTDDYMGQWPELLGLQVEDYGSQGLEWRQIAEERIFPHLRERFGAIQAARRNLLDECEPIYAKAAETLGAVQPLPAVNMVIYVGVGCGAGWVTRYAEKPAILFGLENIAECGWSTPSALTGLIAHELGHVAHHHWRAAQSLSLGSGAWWQLYEEGFAQRCEHHILGAETWHMATGLDDWHCWCAENRVMLADRYLETVAEHKPVREFFGSWYDIWGYRQTGYYLGHEAIRQLEQSLSLYEIALLPPDEIDAHMRLALESLRAEV